MKDTDKTLFDKRLDFAIARLRAFATPFTELYYGIKTRTLPWEWCAFIFVMVGALIACRADVWMFRKAGYAFLYPRNPYLYWPYFFTLAGSGFLLWAGMQTGVRRKLVRQLTEAFNCAGLKSRMGRVPNFIFDKPLDVYTRKLKVTNAKLPLSDFKRAKDTIESGLHIYIDDIKEERSKGTIEITYSHFPMPEICKIESPGQIGGLRFVVGHTRARQLKFEFDKIPHLLIAGQTSSGKSTFLRQLITTTYLNNPRFDFTLIDLKEGASRMQSQQAAA